MRLPLPQLAVVVFVALAVLVGGVLFPLWRGAIERNDRNAIADPHHIAGNLYFVGVPDVTSFLLLGDKGDVLIGGGHEGNGWKILGNIQKLGFDAKNVRILLATHAGDSAAGGLAELQQATGAELWASDSSAGVIAAGGSNNPNTVYTPWKLLARAGITDYPAPRVDHRFKDGETIRLGRLALTAHVLSQGTGCTTWTFDVHDRDRDLHVVHRCSLDVPYRASLVEPQRYPGIRADFERTFKTLRNLPVDIWLTSEGREYGRFRKFDESRRIEDALRQTSDQGGVKGDPVAPFIDPKGYFESIDRAEAAFHKLLAEQQAGRP
jgi:metallo-beta-lactamase class B